MEWKLGEIKQINGEMYQCIRSVTCTGCAFDNGHCTADKHLTGDCSGRLDGVSVIFKKLEKVGEPYMYKGRFVQPYKRDDEFILLEHGSNNIIDYKHKGDMENLDILFKKQTLEYRRFEAAKEFMSVIMGRANFDPINIPPIMPYSCSGDEINPYSHIATISVQAADALLEALKEKGEEDDVQ